MPLLLIRRGIQILGWQLLTNWFNWNFVQECLISSQSYCSFLTMFVLLVAVWACKLWTNCECAQIYTLFCRSAIDDVCHVWYLTVCLNVERLRRCVVLGVRAPWCQNSPGIAYLFLNPHQTSRSWPFLPSVCSTTKNQQKFSRSQVLCFLFCTLFLWLSYLH